MHKNKSLETILRLAIAADAITDGGGIDIDKLRGKWTLDGKKLNNHRLKTVGSGTTESRISAKAVTG